MSDVTRIVSMIESDDEMASEEPVLHNAVMTRLPGASDAQNELVSLIVS